MSKPSRIIILAEDQRHQRFVRKYLERLGHSYHDLYNLDLPNGRGCGEQWVRERYVQAVEAYRERSSRANTALVLAIDANGGDLARRLQQLRNALSGAGVHSRTDGEKIVHLVPRRSIETWVLCLNGEVVNENTDYSGARKIDEQIPTGATTFFDWSRPNVVPPDHCIPSLLSAIPEIRRLD